MGKLADEALRRAFGKSEKKDVVQEMLELDSDKKIKGVHIKKEAREHLDNIKKIEGNFDVNAEKIYDSNPNKPLKELLLSLPRTNDWHKIDKILTGNNAEWDLLTEEGKSDLALEVHNEQKSKEYNEAKVDPSIIRHQVLQLLLERKRREATEIIVIKFLEKEHIYTTRDDERSECWIYKEGIYIPQGKTYIKEWCREILSVGYTTHLANEVIEKIHADTFIEQDKFFSVRDIWRIAVLNGVLNLKTKELEEFSPNHFFFNKIQVNYEQDNGCDAIIKFLTDILPDEKELDVFQELFGYLLLKDYKIEKAFMFTGTGRNGKGKTVELMKRFLGIDNTCNIPIQSLKDDSFNIGEMFNKMANIGADITNEILKETGMFKSLTGRDLISAQRKFLTRVKFTNYAKMVFCANELPITYDKTLAFFNRWVIIDFPYTFLPQKEIDLLSETERINVKLQDPNIIDEISSPQEMKGLLNWALIGLDRLLEQGDFSYSPSTSQVKETWLRKSSSLSAFIMDYVVVDYDGKIKKNDFRIHYTKYCILHNIRPVSDKALKRELVEGMGGFEERYRTLDIDNKVDITYWGGVKFRDDMGDIDDMGFSLLRDFTKFPKSQKTLVTHDTHVN